MTAKFPIKISVNKLTGFQENVCSVKVVIILMPLLKNVFKLNLKKSLITAKITIKVKIVLSVSRSTIYLAMFVNK